MKDRIEDVFLDLLAARIEELLKPVDKVFSAPNFLNFSVYV